MIGCEASAGGQLELKHKETAELSHPHVAMHQLVRMRGGGADCGGDGSEAAALQSGGGGACSCMLASWRWRQKTSETRRQRKGEGGEMLL